MSTTTLIIDNYDSFTWNLFQLIGHLGGEPFVARNDAIDLDGIRKLNPRRIVLSPGPGRPDDPARIGISAAILKDLDIPVLGVCLGHQAIVHAFGGRIIRGAHPTHGKTSEIEHDARGILRDLPTPFSAMRYHSLVADPSQVPPVLTVTGWCKDGTVMAVQHQQRPIYGVQFHPESIGTPHGADLFRAFLRGDLS